MLIKRLEIRGINTLRTVSLDLSQIGPRQVVAVVGPNGWGKSTLMECLCGGILERKIRGGTLNRWATTRDSLLEVDVSYNGGLYTHKLLLDADGGSSGVLAFNGVPVDGTTDKVSDYDSQVSRIYPPTRVLFASAFSRQHTRYGKGTGTMMELGPSDRKDFFSYLLGLGEWERVAQQAAEVRKLLEAEVDGLKKAHAGLVGIDATAAALEAQLSTARAELAKFMEQEELASEDLEAQRATAARRRAELTTLEGARTSALTRQSGLEREADSTRAQRRDLEQERSRLEAVTSQAQVIRDNADRYDALRLQVSTLEQRVTSMEASRRRLEETLQRHERDCERWKRQKGDLERQLEQLEQLELRRASEKLDEKVAQLEEYRRLRQERGAQHRTVLDQLEARQPEYQRMSLQVQRAIQSAQASVEQARQQAALLEKVPCGGDTLYTGEAVYETVDCSTCQFLTTAKQARDRLPQLEEALGAARAGEDDLRALELELQRLKGQANDLHQRLQKGDTLIQQLTPAERELTKILTQLEQRSDLEQRLAETTQQIKDSRASIETTQLEACEQDEALGNAKRDLEIARTDRDRLAGAPGQLSALVGAEARIPAILQQLVQANRTLERIDQDMATIIIPPEPTDARIEVMRLEAARDEASRELEVVRSRIDGAKSATARDEGRLQELQSQLAQRSRIEARIAMVGEHVAAASLLERSLGKHGLQTLEIDAASPAISSILNDLLLVLYGERFTSKLITLTPTGKFEKGTGEPVMKEVFDFEIYDSRDGKGRPKIPSDLSGGEQVAFDTAVRLAICVTNRKRYGHDLRTLWFDESSDGLDETIRATYPLMLRRAMELGDFEQVWVVSHNREIWEASDWVVYVNGGTAELMETGAFLELLRSGKLEMKSAV